MTLQNYIIGRRVSKDSQVTVGPLLKQLIQSFRVKNAFIGADGYDDALGFTGRYDA